MRRLARSPDLSDDARCHLWGGRQDEAFLHFVIGLDLLLGARNSSVEGQDCGPDGTVDPQVCGSCVRGPEEGCEQVV